MSDTPKMTRVDAWESALSFDKQKEVYELCRGLSYETASAVVKERLEIELPPSATYYRFRDRFAKTLSGQRMQYARDAAEAVRELAKACNITSEDLIKSYESRAAIAAFGEDVKSAQIYGALANDIRRTANDSARLRLKEEDLEIAKRKLAIEEAKNAKAVETVQDEKLTDAERVGKIRELFGLK